MLPPSSGHRHWNLLSKRVFVKKSRNIRLGNFLDSMRHQKSLSWFPLLEPIYYVDESRLSSKFIQPREGRPKLPFCEKHTRRFGRWCHSIDLAWGHTKSDRCWSAAFRTCLVEWAYLWFLPGRWDNNHSFDSDRWSPWEWDGFDLKLDSLVLESTKSSRCCQTMSFQDRTGNIFDQK
jgi:hypothetical protein